MKRAWLAAMVLLLACAHVETFGTTDVGAEATDLSEAADLPDVSVDTDGVAREVVDVPDAPDVHDVETEADGATPDVVVPLPTTVTAGQAAVFAGVSTGGKWTLRAISAGSGATGACAGGKWRLRGL